jgi:hypothetical protein
MMVVDRFMVKHYTYDQISKELNLFRQIKLPFESIAADCLVLRAAEIKQQMGEVIVTILSKTNRTICAVSGLSHEGKVYFKRQADLKLFAEFTSLTIKEDLVYVGSSIGSIYVFESVNGNFFKEIPF